MTYSKRSFPLVSILLFSAVTMGQEVPSSFVVSRPIPNEFVLKEIIGSETPHLIRDSYAIKALYSIVSGKVPLAQLSVLVGMEEDEVIQLIEISKTAALQEDRERRIQKHVLCESSDFKSSLEQKVEAEYLYSSLDQFDASISDDVERFFRDEVTRRLGETTFFYLIDWMNLKIKPGMKEVRLDNLKRDIALGRDPYSKIVNFCK